MLSLRLPRNACSAQETSTHSFSSANEPTCSFRCDALCTCFPVAFIKLACPCTRRHALVYSLPQVHLDSAQARTKALEQVRHSHSHSSPVVPYNLCMSLKTRNRKKRLQIIRYQLVIIVVILTTATAILATTKTAPRVFCNHHHRCHLHLSTPSCLHRRHSLCSCTG